MNLYQLLLLFAAVLAYATQAAVAEDDTTKLTDEEKATAEELSYVGKYKYYSYHNVMEDLYVGLLFEHADFKDLDLGLDKSEVRLAVQKYMDSKRGEHMGSFIPSLGRELERIFRIDKIEHIVREVEQKAAEIFKEKEFRQNRNIPTESDAEGYNDQWIMEDRIALALCQEGTHQDIG